MSKQARFGEGLQRAVARIISIFLNTEELAEEVRNARIRLPCRFTEKQQSIPVNREFLTLIT